ncbi:protein containing DUF164 [Candidatus Omnitrophus magneticus]|uniref:Protein containing DUF164 n=1 Tax=Candidatus Omnitrophus magneticus TaxID=1609969 RepID=A0A0F0CLE3_9BACT|nr:protein containing DUF164 [Candidatus Omnitrophus magneticus]
MSSTKPNLRGEIKKLVVVQSIDSEIYDLTEKKNYFPIKISEFDVALELKKTAFNTADKRFKELQVEKNNKENDMRSLEEKINKFNGELAKIKTNKEYKVMLEQMDSAKADISKTEEDILRVLYAIEDAQVILDKEKKIFNEEQKKNQQEKQTVLSEEKIIDDELLKLKEKRESLLAGIAPNIIARYERIKMARGRTALSEVIVDCCSGCNMRLRPQIINEAQLLHDIVICENCMRILYVADKEN